jgi:hypothetical protein
MAIANRPALKGCHRLSTIKSGHFRLRGQDLSAQSNDSWVGHEVGR